MNSGKIYELKVHSHFKEVGHDTIEGIAGSSAIEIPKKKANKPQRRKVQLPKCRGVEEP